MYGNEQQRELARGAIKVATDEAARQAKKQIIKFLISTAPIWGPILLFIILIVIVVASIYGGNSTSNYRSIYSTYTYCESINVNGTLYSLEDYVAGVVQHEAYTSEDEDALMAQAIAARTYALHRTNGCQKSIGNSQSSQTFSPNPGEAAKNAAKKTAGLVLYYNDNIFSAMYDSFCYNDKDCPDAVKHADGSYTVTYKKMPAGEKHTITLSDSSYYGRIVPGGGHASGMSQLVSYQLAKEGMNYEQILKKFYSNGVEIVSILPSLNPGTESAPGTENENSGKGYSSTYTNLKNGKTYFNYKQCAFDVDWICNVGCGLTSTSIIISSENQAITPPYLYRNHRVLDGHVNMSSYFTKYLSKSHFKAIGTVANNKEKVINHLENGGTAIFFVSKAEGCSVLNGVRWTNYQHYFAVLDYNSDNNTVYISNPGTTDKARNGWIPLNNFNCAKVAYLVN